MNGPRLQLAQRQSLSIAPQLAQSIRMLAMPVGELEAFVAERVEANPFLSHAPGSMGRSGGLRVSSGTNAAERVAATPSLEAHLNDQIALAFRERAEAALARQLVQMLDESGYLREDDATLLHATGAPAVMLARVLARCRMLEPAGLFARDLADCLALQLRARDRLDPAMQALLGRLDLVARRDVRAVEMLTGLDAEDVAGMLADIRACDPKPGAGFAEGPPPVLSPVARIVPDGQRYRVELIGVSTPLVAVDRGSIARMRGTCRMRELAGARGAAASSDRTDERAAREWIARSSAEARWLARSLTARARSIARVCEEVAQRQHDYFRHGPAALRPLTLRSVAEALGLHESTVGRTVSGKSIVTPHGTLALRSMFGAGVPATGGALAASAVQERIRDMLRNERPDRVLSDDALAGLLRGEGIDIARRTVAKYREGLGIASSSVRRRERALASA